MGDTAISNEKVFPSYNDVNGGVAGDGMRITEANITKITNGIISRNHILSGFAIPASSADLNLAIPSGQAMIDGRYLTVPGSTTLAMTASTTNYIFLKLQKDGNSRVTNAAFEVNTTGTPPADSIYIGQAVTSGSAVTRTIDERVFGFIGVNQLEAYTPGTSVLASSDGVATESGGSYVKVKEIVVANRGTFNTYFEIQGSSAPSTAVAQVRRNGVAVGTERTKAGTGYTAFNEDIGGWVAGDLYQLYLKETTGADANAQNFRLRVASTYSGLYRAEIVNL